jgi:type IV pilus assembly protein PilY1
LALPASGTRHLFANTTLLKTGYNEPLLRVLTDNRYRIPQWLSIERPVAGDKCVHGISGPECQYAATTEQQDYPMTADQYDALIASWAVDEQKCGEGALSANQINTASSNYNNPFTGSAYNDCGHDTYLTVIDGMLYAPVEGTYRFSTNGDDAVEFWLNGQRVSWWYGGHGRRTGTASDNAAYIGAQSTGNNGEITLAAGWYPFEFRHFEKSGEDNYQLLWERPGSSWEVVPVGHFSLAGDPGETPSIRTWKTVRTLPASVRTDYEVRVEVCNASALEPNCRLYASGNYKPVGLLHNYGEDDRMLFGLLSGAYRDGKNIAGGVLRKNVESFSNEVDVTTGQFSSTEGIVRTLDQFRIVDFNSSQTYQYNGGWLTSASLSSGTYASKFPDWGNPVGEMMYETLRYFSGKSQPTPEFMPVLTSGRERVTLRDDVGLGYMDLPAPEWTDPLADKPWCTACAKLVISDVNPSYDTQYIPGSAFSSFVGDVDGLNASEEADAIWQAEHGDVVRQHFIGQAGDDYDGAPTEKPVSGLGNIRGLSPAEPTKEGGYYSAAVARFGYENDIRPEMEGKQTIQTFSVALASPLPEIKIPVNGRVITIVPFAKSVSGSSINGSRGAFQPTNTIVDFFVETFANTDPEGSDRDMDVNNGLPYVKFMLNFEDVEQGADHDMDAMVSYELKANSDHTLSVSLTSVYAAGGIEQHMGYIISGTNQDGVYLEVRDCDTANSTGAAGCSGNSPSTVTRYYLDTPPGAQPGECASTTPSGACQADLPLYASRVFTPGDTSGATLLNNPLWYAAKYGSSGNDGLQEGETSPNYFLVTNASTLERQLANAFQSILDRTGSSAAVSFNTSTLNADSSVFLVIFNSHRWSGKLFRYALNPLDGSVAPLPQWEAASVLDQRELLTDPRTILTRSSAGPIPFKWDVLDESQKADLRSGLSGADVDAQAQARLDYLRGDRTHEGGGYQFRVRSSRLGDIVHSNPVFVGQPSMGWPSQPPFPGVEVDSEGNVIPGTDNRYQTWSTSVKDRTSVLYVGGNDGMLHAFRAEDGKELLAYIPSNLFSTVEGEGLNALTRADYAHRYYVDLTPVISDVWINDPATNQDQWKTVLIGGQRAGGRGLFALDVTEPDAFSDDAAVNTVLWEFTDADLGHTFSEPTVCLTNAGDWVAVMGNGYNDTGAGEAQLFVLKLEGGMDGTWGAEDFWKISTQSGDAVNRNGLSTPSVIDLDGNGTCDRVYAGDLDGNLWAFDLDSMSIPYTQKVGSVYVPVPLFTAAADQAITVRPQVIKHPEITNAPAPNVLVYFGTGQYLVDEDKNSTTQQTFYAVWDRGEGTVASSSLVEQALEAGFDPAYRVMTDNAVEYGASSAVQRDYGWYFDLPASGERVVTHPVVRGSFVYFNTLVPSSDPCSYGGDGWTMALPLATGGRASNQAFDINDDGKIDEQDWVDSETIADAPPAGLEFMYGIPAESVFLGNYQYTPGSQTSDGEGIQVRRVENLTGDSTGRLSWQEILR